METASPLAGSARGSAEALRLSALIELERQARSLGAAELGYLIVNSTLNVVAYQQAAFWRDGRVASLSGVDTPDTGGPYYRWVARALGAAAASPWAREQRVVTAAELGVPSSEWDEWFPPEAVWCPLVDRRHALLGGVLFGRHDPWRESELHLLATLAGTYAMSLAMEELPTRRAWHRRRPRRFLLIGVVAAAVAASLIPVRSSVLAPAEIVAAAPYPIRAPFDGVVASVKVTPNASVKRGDLLVSFDTTEQRAKTQVAEKALQIARDEYAEESQLALTDLQAKARMPILQARVAQAQEQLTYDRSVLARAAIRAPIDGVAVFDDAQRWSGHPAVLGERIMVVSPPDSADLDIQVPIADVLTFKKHAEVVFFPNVDPDHPVQGRLTYAGYDSAPAANGILAYTFRAHLESVPNGLRLGLKGTAKIFGARRPFLLWALRRPLAVVREWLTL